MLTPSRKQQILSIVPMYRALYYGQKVLMHKTFDYPLELRGDIINCDYRKYLSLRSVKDLTEEEAATLYNMCQVIGIRDCLRSMGIATDYWHPTTGLITVDELIEAGVLQVKD